MDETKTFHQLQTIREKQINLANQISAGHLTIQWWSDITDKEEEVVTAINKELKNKPIRYTQSLQNY